MENFVRSWLSFRGAFNAFPCDLFSVVPIVRFAVCSLTIEINMFVDNYQE